MDLRELCAVGAAPKPEKPHRFAVVNAAGRALYLQAEGEEELAAWLAAFRSMLPMFAKEGRSASDVAAVVAAAAEAADASGGVRPLEE
jgi:hypothetical protein